MVTTIYFTINVTKQLVRFVVDRSSGWYDVLRVDTST